jgi:hypothetical protein
MIPSVNNSQAHAIETKAANWVSYLDELADNINKDGVDRFHILRVASLWSSTFAYIEWLTCFYERKILPSSDQINKVAGLLNDVWSWDLELAKLFWKSGRHPLAHVGQANSFHTYGKYKELDTNVSFDVGYWSEAVTNDWDKYHTYKAVAVLPPLEVEGQNLQIVYFHHQMMRSDLLPMLSRFVVDSILAETDEQKLKDIIELNRQIPH